MRRLIPLLLLLCWLPAQAAPTWFWRLEGTTFDGTHDHANGSADATATTNAAASLSATAARVGTTGGLFGPSSSDQFRFDTSTDMVNRLLGAVGFSVRFTTLTDGVQGVCNLSGVAGNYIFQVGSDGEVRVITNLEGTGESQVVTSGAGIVTGNWYGIVYRWDHANSLRRIEVYDSSNVLIVGNTDATAFTAPTDLATGDGLRIGNTDGGNSTIHIDNFFIADAYAEPIEQNLTITSFTGYGGGGSGVTQIRMLENIRNGAGPHRSQQLGGILEGH